MEPVSRRTPISFGKVEDFMATAMRNIRNLQKQLKDIGERYQNELAHPTTGGPEEQEILMELARQMSSVQHEIDALQQSIIEHQAVEQLRKVNHAHLKISNEDEKTLQSEKSEQNSSVTNASQQSGQQVKKQEPVDSGTAPSATKNNPMSAAGSVINTYA